MIKQLDADKKDIIKKYERSSREMGVKINRMEMGSSGGLSKVYANSNIRSKSKSKSKEKIKKATNTSITSIDNSSRLKKKSTASPGHKKITNTSGITSFSSQISSPKSVKKVKKVKKKSSSNIQQSGDLSKFSQSESDYISSRYNHNINNSINDYCPQQQDLDLLSPISHAQTNLNCKNYILKKSYTGFKNNKYK
jgi:hypothetical protein